MTTDASGWINTDRSRRRAVITALARHPLLTVKYSVLRQRGLSERYPYPRTRAEVLRRLVELPVSTWTYGWEHETVKHLGPMAQDFARAFGLGASDRRIEGVDESGVLIAAVQELHRRIEHLEAEVTRLREHAEPSGGDLRPETS